jgi:hypothetical protein
MPQTLPKIHLPVIDSLKRYSGTSTTAALSFLVIKKIVKGTRSSTALNLALPNFVLLYTKSKKPANNWLLVLLNEFIVYALN